MKKVSLLFVLSALLVALGFAQTPAASSNPDQINIKGCLSGSDGNYTVAEDNTGQVFKITTSSADLKPHVGQDVKLTGQKASSDSSVAVTELNMISEHCTAAAAAPAAAVGTPSENVSTPPAAAAPIAAAPAAAVSTPSDNVSTPPVAAAAPAVAPAPTGSIAEENVSTPAAAPSAAPAATVSTPAETASAPAAAAAVHPTRRSARPPKPAVKPASAAAPAEPVSPPVAAAPSAPVGPPAETASTPAAPAAKASTGRSAGMLVSIVVVVLLIGAGVPLYNRWRKRRLLEEAKGQNLSFTKEAKSDPGKSDSTGGRKAA